MYDTLCKQQLLKTNCLCLQKFLSLLRKINQTASLHKIQITIINFQNKQANVAVRKQRIYNVVEISLLQGERPSGQGIELPIQTFPVANHRVPPPTQVNPLSLAGQQSQHQGSCWLMVTQRLIENPVKLLRWSVLRKWLSTR